MEAVSIHREELQRRLEHQREYFDEGVGNLLIFGSFSEGHAPCAMPSTERLRTNPSEELVARHAYDLGVECVRKVKALTCDQMGLDDDACSHAGVPFLASSWGVGATTALFTGQSVVFEKATTYTKEPFLENWEDMARLRLVEPNRWFDYDVAFWKGVASEYEDGLPVCVHRYRSPLDLASDLRGDRFFLDLHDEPDKLHQLLDLCTEAIISVDRLYSREIALIRQAPGGIRGVVLPRPHLVWLNGDPVDLISEKMGRSFNTPYVERLASYGGSLYFHHHSIGVARARSVASIPGLTIQNLLQDPNGPRLIECIDDELIEASLISPIDLILNLSLTADFDRLSPNWGYEKLEALEPVLEKLSRGRFVVRVWASDKHDCQRLVERAKRFQHTRRIVH